MRALRQQVLLVPAFRLRVCVMQLSFCLGVLTFLVFCFTLDTTNATTTTTTASPYPSSHTSANRQGGQDMLEGEIAKLRAAIYSLRQRKTLNNSDKELLRILTAKLKALHQL
jgi:hypothetical protein